MQDRKEDKMTIKYVWSVQRMVSYPEKYGYSDVVFNINWSCNATDGDHSSTNFGNTIVEFDQSKPFTEYSSLTESQVIGWVKEALGDDEISSIENFLANEINKLINPPVITLPNPWS